MVLKFDARGEGQVADGERQKGNGSVRHRGKV